MYKETYHTLVLEINLVTEDDEGEVVGVAGTSLDEELISPAVQVLEGLGNIHIKDQDAAVGTTVERNTERLEALLAGGIPELPQLSEIQGPVWRHDVTCLHRDQSVIYHYLLGQAAHDSAKSRHLRRDSDKTHKSAPMVALYWLLKRLLTY